MKKIKFVIYSLAMFMLLGLCSFSAFAGDSYVVGNEEELRECWDSALSNDGIICIANNIRLTNEYSVDKGSVTIDLQGNNIEGIGEDADAIFIVENGASLTIVNNTDSDEGTIYVSTLYEDYEQLVSVEEDSTFILKGGKLKGNQDEDCRIVTVEEGSFVMSGGYLHDGAFTGDGAAVYVNDGEFEMSGGTITGINSLGGCAAVYINDSVFTMFGGKITGNTSDGAAAGVFINENTFWDAAFYMFGGEISKNKNTSLEVSGMYAGGVAVSEGEFEMSGGLISDNTSELNGGGIYFNGDSEPMKMTGGTVRGNTAANVGGGIYIADGTAVLSGGEIIGNSARYYGGGIFTSNTADGVELTGNLFITQNDAGVSGSGVYICDEATIVDNNTVTLGGSVKVYGNNGNDIVNPCEENDRIIISSDIDTTPENHAWVGIGEYVWRDYPEEGDLVEFYTDNDDTDYSVCFFCNDEYGGPFSLLVKTPEGEMSRFALSMKQDAMTDMDLDKTAIRNIEGNVVPESGYTVEFDKTLLTYTVKFKPGASVFIDESTEYLVQGGHREGSTTEIPTTKASIDAGDGVTTYTLNYLCKNTRTNVPGSVYTRNVYYVVKFIVPDHTVTYEMNGHGGRIDDVIVADSCSIEERPADPTEDGWRFCGWYTDKELTQEFDFDNSIFGDTTIYAKWTEETVNSHDSSDQDPYVPEQPPTPPEELVDNDPITPPGNNAGQTQTTDKKQSDASNSTPSETSAEQNSPVATGDTSLMGLWITVMLVSAMGFAVCVTKKKRVK